MIERTGATAHKRSLDDLAMIGNGNVSALIDERAEIVWACMPRMDGDAVFCSILREHGGERDFGYFAIDLENYSHSEQEYQSNTAIVVTRLYDTRGGALEVVDFAPRYNHYGRRYCPMTLVRELRPLAGNPRLRVLLRPAFNYGDTRPAVTYGSNHVRYVGPQLVVRVTTDCSVAALVDEVPIVLQRPMSFVLGADETLQGAVADVVRGYLEKTTDYWVNWVRDLSIPYEWQDTTIRAAITLKLSAVDDTGAIVAAMTTSIPESAGTERNWDYRFCWMRDAYFTVNALNRLNATRTMERYLGYIINVSAGSNNGGLQPVYRINGASEMEEYEVPALPGYRDMGPVRVGNQAYTQVQNDVYGSAILAAMHIFVDRRFAGPGNDALFTHLEALGEHAAVAWSQPDAGLWELRGSLRVHTFSSVMCWAGCDRLAKIAALLGRTERSQMWRTRADTIHRGICEQAWSDKRGCFVSSFGGDGLDASLLLLADLGFVDATDPRFAATVGAVERELRKGDFVYRYNEADDFGVPQNAFVVCSFWFIEALVTLGRRDEAREMYENLLLWRNRHGLLAEHIDPVTRALWGNFPQTYSMVGLINSARRLSLPWERGL